MIQQNPFVLPKVVPKGAGTDSVELVRYLTLLTEHAKAEQKLREDLEARMLLLESE